MFDHTEDSPDLDDHDLARPMSVEGKQKEKSIEKSQIFFTRCYTPLQPRPKKISESTPLGREADEETE